MLAVSCMVLALTPMYVSGQSPRSITTENRARGGEKLIDRSIDPIPAGHGSCCSGDGGGAAHEAGLAGSGGLGAGAGLHGHVRLPRAVQAGGRHGGAHPPRRRRRRHPPRHRRHLRAARQRGPPRQGTYSTFLFLPLVSLSFFGLICAMRE